MAVQKSSSLVAVIMGSASDWETMSGCVKTLDELNIPNEAHVLSAHRTPDATAKFAREAADYGVRVMIAAAGGAAHLLAAAILATSDEKIRQNLQAFRKKQTDTVLAAKLPT